MQLEQLKNKEDLVFVGGFAMWKHGIKDCYSDIDIVVKNLDGIENHTVYETDSKFSKSGKRAFVKTGEIAIDIFIEDDLPEFETIDGCKVRTIKSMIDYFENLLPQVTEHWQNFINQNLKILKDE